MTRFITVLFLALTCVPALAQRYPPGGGGGCATYANQAALPLSAIDGTCAVTLDADTMWVYNLSGAAWKVIGIGGSTVTSIGAFGSSPNANGGSIASSVLTLQPADGTHPGGVSIASQSFAGNKTFTGTIGASNLSGTNTGDVSLAAFGSTPNANGLSLSSQAINLQPADSTHPGGLLAADWNTFNSKQSALSFGALSDVGTDGIVVTGGSGAVIGSGTSLAQHVADATHNGYLLAADWSTFNGKQSSGNYITALTGDVTASGPGSVAASLVATSNATLATLSALTTASSLASIGTITSGTWNGTSVAVNHGGTGVATLTNHGVLVGAGTSNVTQLAAAAAGSVLTGQGSSADPSFSATPTLGVAGTTTGNLAFAGSTSGTITLKPQVAAGTWEWDFPITAGNAGQVLTSQGGAGTAMTWTAALTNPMTTGGDIIYGGSAGAATRLANGSVNQVLTSAGGTSAPSWSYPGPAYVSQASTLNPAAINTWYVLSGASFTVTLPDATTAGYQGKQIMLQHNGTSLTQAYTLSTTSAQTINGPGGTVSSGSYVLQTNGEKLILASDGSNWQVVQHDTITGWLSGGTISLTATSAYVFTVTAANATAGAVYSNNSHNFTVTTTIAGGTTLTCSGNGTPAASGTLTKVSGTGDATITFSSKTTTGVPVLGTTTSNAVTYRRVGSVAEVNYFLNQSGAGTAGSGDYILFLPSGMQIDTTRAAQYLGSIGTFFPQTQGSLVSAFPGTGWMTVSGSYQYFPIASTWWVDGSTGGFRFGFGNNYTGNFNWGSGASALSQSTLQLYLTFYVPVSGWQP